MFDSIVFIAFGLVRLLVPAKLDSKSEPSGERNARRREPKRIQIECDRTRCNAKEAGLRIDGSQLAVFVELHPGNVIANASHLVAWQCRLHHGQIGFATGGRKGGNQVLFFAGRICDGQNEHVLGQPSLTFAQNRADSKGKTLFAEQRIASVALSTRRCKE